MMGRALFATAPSESVAVSHKNVTKYCTHLPNCGSTMIAVRGLLLSSMLLGTSVAQNDCSPKDLLECLATNCQKCSFSVRRNLHVHLPTTERQLQQQDDYCDTLLEYLDLDLVGACECCPQCATATTEFYNNCFLGDFGCFVDGCAGSTEALDEAISSTTSATRSLSNIVLIQSMLLSGLGFLVLQ